MSQKTSVKEEIQGQENKTTESIQDKIRRNIEKMNETKKNSGGNFIKFQPGETKTLTFTGDMEPVQRTFKRKNDTTGQDEESTKIMYAYKVVDMQHQDEVIKVWECSRSWSDSINNLLVKNFLTLEIKRTGSGTETSYLFAPVVASRAS